MRHAMRASLGILATSLLLAACAQPPGATPPSASLALDPQQQAERLARPTVYDWSSRTLASAAVERLRRTEQKRDRRLLSLAVASQTSGDDFAGSKASGRISAPAFNAETRQLFWVAENGWLLRRDLDSGQEVAFPISAVDGTKPTHRFPNTHVTLSKDGARVYLCSERGDFFVLDSQTGKNLINSPFAMGGNDASIGFTPAPYVDELAGSADGKVESVYAITNKGTLFRFYVDGSGANSPPYAMKAETYQLGGITAHLDGSTSTPQQLAKERFLFSPVVVRGQVYIQGWRNDNVNLHGHMGGRAIFYDTHAQTATLAPVSGQWPRLGRLSWGCTIAEDGHPLALRLDANLQPEYVFHPEGISMRVINLTPQALGAWADSDFIAAFDTMPTQGKAGQWGEAGLFDPGEFTLPPCTAAAVDPLGDRIFTISCNALFQLDFHNEAMTTYPDIYNDRRARFRAFEYENWYAKTALGRTDGCQDANGEGIRNTSPPYFDGTHVFVLDNYAQPDGSTKVTLNRFLPGDKAPPTLVESIDLTALAPDAAAIGVPGIAVDPVTTSLFLTTRNSTGPARARLWTVGL